MQMSYWRFAAMIATSYPDFMAHMAELGADIRQG